MSDVLTVERLLAAKRVLDEKAPPSLPKWDGVIHENQNLTISKTRIRSWGERLLTWPWRPWQRFFTWSEPDPNIYKIPYDGISVLEPMRPPHHMMWFAHPVTAQRVRQALQKGGSEK